MSEGFPIRIEYDSKPTACGITESTVLVVSPYNRSIKGTRITYFIFLYRPIDRKLESTHGKYLAVAEDVSRQEF